jgi:hypothetical protein
MKELKKYSANANTVRGFNFDYVCLETLKEDWYLYSKRNRYDRFYFVKHFPEITATSLRELKKIIDGE